MRNESFIIFLFNVIVHFQHCKRFGYFTVVCCAREAEDKERYEQVWFCRVCQKTIQFEKFARKHEKLHGSSGQIIG